MAENKIFRKVSLDRLSSPEELDQRLTVITPIGWVALTAAGILVLAGLIWGIYGRIPEKAVGQGMLLASGGITSVIHHAGGQITDVAVHDGDYVEKGQVIARMEQTELITQINKYKEDLTAAQAIDTATLQLNESQLNFNIYSKIADLYKNYAAARASVESQRASYRNQKAQDDLALEQARIQYENSRNKFSRTQALYTAGAISQSEFDAARNELALNEFTYNSKKNNALPPAQLREAEANLESQRQALINTIQMSILDMEKNIQTLQSDLVSKGEIVAAATGRVLELRVKKGDLVQAGAVICTIAQEQAQTDALEAVVYVPVDQGKKIQPGMEVNISPSTVKKEEYGSLLGNVVWVSEYPASAQGMLLTLGNNELVQKLAGGNTPLEVRIKLVMDSKTVSHYKWSTPEGPPLLLDGGTICVGEVKVAERRPISMVIPFIKKLLPL